MAQTPIIPLTTIPSPGTLPTDPSLVNKVLVLDMICSELLVTGTVSEGSGQGFLCYWVAEANAGAGAWYEWASDAVSGGWAVDASKKGGRFCARLQKPPKRRMTVVAVVPGETAECFLDPCMAD